MNFNSLISITATYPGFQSLPRGVKQMLLISESLFFEEARTPQDLHSAHHQHKLQEEGAHDLLHLLPPNGRSPSPPTSSRAVPKLGLRT